jgi:hypothetical protein
MSLRGGVLDVYLYIVVSPPVRGFPAYLHTYTCIYMWPLAPMKYNLSIPNRNNLPWQTNYTTFSTTKSYT